LKKGIEYNGEYWHNSKYSKFKDKIKIEQCKAKDIDLLVVKENDWLDNKRIELKHITRWLKGVNVKTKGGWYNDQSRDSIQI